MRVKLPEYYRVTIDYFNTQVDDNKRVALLPEPTFWGWFSQKWGYDGSGFIWYGIKQPVISRTFDVWSLKSESYYWEIKHAIESQNKDLFEDTLNKYNVSYLILDKTLKPLNNVEESMQYDQLERIIKSSEAVSLEKEFGELLIYRVHQSYGSMAFGAVLEDIVSVGPSINLTNKDQAFNDLAFYRDSPKPDYIYPFLDLTTQNLINGKRWKIEDAGDKLVFSSNLSDYNLANYTLVEDKELLKATLFLGDEIKEIEQSATTTIVDGKLIVTISKDEALSFRPSNTEVRNCSNLGDFEINRDGDFLNIKTTNAGVACFGYSSKLLPHWNGYLVQLEMDNIEGKNLFFYIFGNWLRKQAKIENVLSEGTNYQIINPGYLLDDGYFFSFQNQSTEKRPSHNELKSLKIYLLPVNYLKTLRLERAGFNAPEVNANFTVAPRIEKINYHTYILNSESQEDFNFILLQSFDEGWKAYKVNKDSRVGDFLPLLGGQKVEDHFTVNSWANGWNIDRLDDGEKLVVIYEPQILQDIGLAILLITLTVSAIFFVREPSIEQ